MVHIAGVVLQTGVTVEGELDWIKAQMLTEISGRRLEFK